MNEVKIVILTISGELIAGVNSYSAKKMQDRLSQWPSSKAFWVERYTSHYGVLEEVEVYHDNLVNNIGDANARRILIDIGSSCDILFIGAFKQIEIYEKELIGFNNSETLYMINISPHIIQWTPKASSLEGRICGYGYQVAIWCKYGTITSTGSLEEFIQLRKMFMQQFTVSNSTKKTIISLRKCMASPFVTF